MNLSVREMAKLISDDLINMAIKELTAKDYLLDEDGVFTSGMMKTADDILFVRIKEKDYLKELKLTSHYDKDYGEVTAYFVLDEFETIENFEEAILFPYIKRKKKEYKL